MRIILFLLFVIVCNCSSQIYKVDYNSFNKTLKDVQLNGSVKDVLEYRLVENNEKGINSYDTIMISVTKFTDFGLQKYHEYYNRFGDLQNKSECKFTNNKLTGYKAFIPDMNIQKDICISEATLEYINNQIILKLFNDGVLNQHSIFTVDKNNLPLNLYEINYGNAEWGVRADTVSIIYEYRYNNNGKIIQKKQINKERKSNRVFTTYNKYNKANKLIRNVTYEDSTEIYKNLHSYDFPKEQHTIKRYINKKLFYESTYDKDSKLIIFKAYNESLEIKEIIYFQYTKYDKYNNWIEKRIKYSDFSVADSTNIRTELIKREISYYTNR